MKSNRITKNNLFVLIFLFSCVFITSSLVDFKFDIQEQQNSEKFNVRSSDHWDLTGSPIFIDDADPNYNWSKTSNDYSWCSGSGTWNDPYIIENVTIDGQDSSSCITIQNSSVFFIIRNCTLSRAGWNFDGGIKLDNVGDSLLIGNHLTQNSFAGIFLVENCVNNTIMNNQWYRDSNNCIHVFKNCSNNRILNNMMIDSGGDNIRLIENNNNNIIHGNYFTGVGDAQAAGAAIRLDNYCDKNTISNNNLSYSYTGGIILDSYCDENIIKNNFISNNLESHGILFVWYCDNNIIFNNTIVENGFISFGDGYGLYFYEECDNNNITQNVFTDNDYRGMFLSFGSGNNTISENVIGNTKSSNQETGIFLEDSSDNIITSNSFLNNTWRGIDINANSNDTQIHLNFFLNSGTEHARDLSTNNNWNSSTIGNFWDTYVGVDDNQDGIGDAPYNFGTGIDYLPIHDDDTPNINIVEPFMNQVCGVNSPNFIVEISDAYLDTMWYSVNNSQNVTFYENDIIDQIIWNGLVDGSYEIVFYANDTFEHATSESVIIVKDTLNPTIDIISPLTGITVENETLDFVVEIFDDHLDKMWYTIDSGTTKSFFTVNGTVQEWSDLPNGPVTITFYANDSAGNEFSIYTTVIKQIPDNGNGNGGGVPGYNILLVFLIMTGSIGLIVVIANKKIK